MKKPEFTPVTAWPPEVREALMQLIAFTVNQSAEVMNFNVHQASVPGRKLGSWEIRVTKTEE